MTMRGFVVAVVSVTLIVLSAGVTRGQSYPNKPIRIVTSEVGGTVDLLARLIGPGLSAALGQSVITENRPTIVAIETVSKSAPDGYTLSVAAGTLWIGPLLQKMPYNSTKDFAPISLLTGAANVLVVHPSLPVKSVKELISLAKAKPGELNFSTSPVGSYPFLSAHLFRSMAGVNITGISYKGSGQALTSVIAGEVQMTFATPGSLAPHLKSNRLRALAVTSPEPSVLAPGLPTVAASGVPGYESVAAQGMFAPAGTPVAIVNRLNQEVVRFLTQPNTKEQLLTFGLETFASSPERLAATMQSEITKWGKVIKDAGIRAE